MLYLPLRFCRSQVRKFSAIVPVLQMDVTKDNFREVYKNVEESILDQSCCFVSIDTEFTGISIKNEEERFMDTLEERYLKLRGSGQNFLVTQCGLSSVHYDQIEKAYSIRTWNFYLFPRTFGTIDRRFSCQASSLEFLSSHGFDFNKFIYKGISYLRTKEQRQLKDKLLRETDSIKKKSPQRLVLTKPNDKEFLAEIKAKISSWIDKEKDAQDLVIPCRNSYHRLIIHYAAKKYFSNVYTESSNNAVILRHLTVAQAKARDEERILQKRQEYDDAIGFSKVIQLLHKSKKPVVGHNALLDFIYIYSQFHDELPETLDEFKQELSKLLPRIYDTKHIISSTPLINKLFPSSLGNVFTIISDKLQPSTVESLNASGYHQYSTDGPAHEAGYDAFMTAVTFLGITSSAFDSWNLQSTLRTTFHDDLKLLDGLKNRLHLTKSDALYINLHQPQQQVDRKFVYRLTTSGKIGSLDIDAILPNIGIQRVIRDSLSSAFLFTEAVIPMEIIMEIKKKHPELQIVTYDDWKVKSNVVVQDIEEVKIGENGAQEEKPSMSSCVLL